MSLFAVVAGSLVWMHMAIRAMERERMGEALEKLPELPEMQPIHGAAQAVRWQATRSRTGGRRTGTSGSRRGAPSPGAT
jgi:hypothetical protein